MTAFRTRRARIGAAIAFAYVGWVSLWAAFGWNRGIDLGDRLVTGPEAAVWVGAIAAAVLLLFTLIVLGVLGLIEWIGRGE